jgi:protein phosphatase
MEYFGMTDVGQKRSVNQDSFCIKEYEGAILAVVCDGMGGAAGGAEASGMACSEFVGVIDERIASRRSSGPLSRRAVRDMMMEGVSSANEIICAKSRDSEELRGMGTTLVASLVCDGMIYTVNVGDSRMYLISGGEIHQISHDHSFVQYLVDKGKLTPDEARRSINRNIITRAVGTEATVEADFFATKLPSDDSSDYYGDEAEGDIQDGAYIVLCSDGLTNHVEPITIKDVLSNSSDSVEERTRTLIKTANDGGGSDNITAVVIKLR